MPVAAGPLAIQPPDIQTLEAATMQTSSWIRGWRMAGCRC